MTLAQFPGVGPFEIAIVGTVVGTGAMVVLVYPFVRALAKRIEPRETKALPIDVTARLARIEAAVESIAVEVERISEGQRYLTKLQSERPLPSGEASDRTG